MSSKPQKLHVALFPFLAHGHMIPILDIARLLASRDVKATIITTTANAPTFNKAIQKGSIIDVEVLRFPTQEVGLPEGLENAEQLRRTEEVQRFFMATEMLKDQLEQYLEKARPNCLVSDMYFPWTADIAAKFGIPRVMYVVSSYFALCGEAIVQQYEPYKSVSSDEEPFDLPRIPHQVKFLRTEIAEDIRNEECTWSKRFEVIKEAELKNYGVIVNSFYELEPDYADLYSKEFARKVWHLGPLSLSNKSIKDKVRRGKDGSIDEHECLKWLNSKNPDSVIYLCFGSTSTTIAPQLHEIAIALEHSGQNFIWVVRNGDKIKDDEWLPQGFEERMEGKGMIIRGWAPQVLILEHEAIGAFVTHCGWNSTLEGISSGVPMVTWPLFADQFYNEKLVTQILRIGVPVGAKKWSVAPCIEDVIKHDVIEKTLREVMEGKEAQEMRSKAKKLKEMAWKAVEEGGSSYSNLTTLINELSGYCSSIKED